MRRQECPGAVAWVRGGKDYPQIRGTVKFYRTYDGTAVEAELTGLPETASGFFAFHIHEGKNCQGDGFPETGGHYNPDGAPHPNHRGDLPPLLSNSGGAYMLVLTGRFSVEEVIGRTVILHAGPDDFHTQPAGNPGPKIACGVIQRI